MMGVILLTVGYDQLWIDPTPSSRSPQNDNRGAYTSYTHRGGEALQANIYIFTIVKGLSVSDCVLMTANRIMTGLEAMWNATHHVRHVLHVRGNIDIGRPKGFGK